MELEKRQVQTKEKGKEITSQFLVQEDYNVPDSKEDVKDLLRKDGKVEIREVKAGEHGMIVRGDVRFSLLYQTDSPESKLKSLEGKIPFEELVYTEEKGKAQCRVREVKMDFQADLIHSRKVSIKAVLDLTLQSEEIVAKEWTVHAEADFPICQKKVPVQMLSLQASRKDTYRIKEKCTLPGTKETMQELLWSDLSCGRLDVRPEDGEFFLSGELLLFCFYESPEGKPDWIESRIPYEGRILCPEASSGMYHHVKPRMIDILTEIRPDGDGEMRVIGVEATLEMEIEIWAEEEMEVLEDAYALSEKCIPDKKVMTYEEPVMQNLSKCKVIEQLSLPELEEDILQICHSSGRAQIERIAMTEEGIMVEGVLHICFLYVKANDTLPFAVWQGMVPFFHMIGSNETGSEIRYDLTGDLEQLSISLLGGDSVEVKAILSFSSLVRKERKVTMVAEMDVEPFTQKELEEGPTVVGYVVREGDCLWDLAKKYHTTEAAIREGNHLSEENVKPGCRILIFKENMGIL